ncbi:MAG: hypothetical protein KKD28_01600 [Chloroflexi bacterium]|nr:hypothetical protein [Chloroflexota bacterium]
MKVIEIERTVPTLDEVMELADRELVILRHGAGKTFAIWPVDEFDLEAEILKNNPEFMTFMSDLSREKTLISSQQLRQELGL